MSVTHSVASMNSVNETVSMEAKNALLYGYGNGHNRNKMMRGSPVRGRDSVSFK